MNLYNEADYMNHVVRFRTFRVREYHPIDIVEPSALTGDGWSTDIVRPLFREDGHVDPVVVAFFVSYILLAGYFLLNIIVAV